MKKHKHIMWPIHPGDVLRTKCLECGKFFETNPYSPPTEKPREISKEQADYYFKWAEEKTASRLK